MFIYFEVFFIDGRSRIRHKQVSWPLFKEPVYLEISTKKPQSLRKTNAAKWKIEKRTAISGCRVQFFLYGRLLFTHALWRANCPSSLDWLMGPSFFFFFFFVSREIYTKAVRTLRVTQLLAKCDGHSDIFHWQGLKNRAQSGVQRGPLQSIILSGYVIFRQRVSRSLSRTQCDNDSYFHLFNWCIKRLQINFQFCNYCI